MTLLAVPMKCRDNLLYDLITNRRDKTTAFSMTYGRQLRDKYQICSSMIYQSEIQNYSIAHEQTQ